MFLTISKSVPYLMGKKDQIKILLQKKPADKI